MEKKKGESAFYMKKHPHAITQSCPKCGREFTCKGEGWRLIMKNGVLICPYSYTGCVCQKCNPPPDRGLGCEEVELREIVQFT
jgi:hypothetical protein